MTTDRCLEQSRRLLDRLAGEFAPERDFPALLAQLRRWEQSRPLAGLKILVGTPLFLNTMAQYAALFAAGAEVTAAYSDELGFDPDMPAFLAKQKIPAVYGTDAAGASFDAVLDCSGINRHIPARLGYCELTRSGIHAYENDMPDAPVFASDSGRIKSIETCLGTGDGCLRGLQELGVSPAGKIVLLFGHGRVGRGIEFALTRAGASVRIVDPAQNRPFTPALLDGADIVVSATGIRDVLAPFSKILRDSKALLVNMGADDEFGADIAPARAVNAKRPVNFMLKEPTLTRYIDPTLALHNAGALVLLHQKNRRPGFLAPPSDLEESILSDVRTAGVIDGEISAMGL